MLIAVMCSLMIVKLNHTCRQHRHAHVGSCFNAPLHSFTPHDMFACFPTVGSQSWQKLIFYILQ